MNIRLKKTILIPLYLYMYIQKKFIQFNNFYWPNWNKIISNKISFASTPKFYQRTFFTGVGKVEIGNNCSFGYKLGGFHYGGSIELQPRYKISKIKIGNNVATNNNLFFCAANYIEIGVECLIGQNVTIMDHEAHGITPDKRKELGEVGRVIIGNNVWIGNNVTILKNSDVGDNSVIATGAVVTGKFPANVIIGGVPAKILKEL